MHWPRLHRHDSRLFDRVARSRTRRLDALLPTLSVCANNSLLWIAVGSLLAALGRRRGKRAAGRGIGSITITSLLVNQVIKRLIRRPRPSLRRIPAVRRLDHQPLTTSFPSGHAASAAAFVTGVFIEWRPVGVALAPLAAVVGYSRVYVGVHYPLDVACGAAVGIAVAQLTRLQFPTMPADGGSTAPAATEHRLPADRDGDRIGIAVKEDAGSPIDGDVAARLRNELPGANVLEVGDDDDLLGTLGEAAAGRAAIGVAGGDGSAAAGAQVALERNLPLLVVPAGTLNHLARDLRIDRKTEAIDAYRSGEAVAIDVGDADGELFVNTLTFGAYPEMIERREQLQSRIGRWPAHVLAATRAIFTADPLEVSINGHQRLIWMAFVGNCHHDPAGFAPAWRPRLDDGLLDLRLLHAERPLARARLLVSILIGRLTSSAAYEQSDLTEITVDCGEAELALTLDGDPRTVSGRFRIIKRRRALVVFTPIQGAVRTPLNGESR